MKSRPEIWRLRRKTISLVWLNENGYTLDQEYLVRRLLFLIIISICFQMTLAMADIDKHQEQCLADCLHKVLLSYSIPQKVNLFVNILLYK